MGDITKLRCGDLEPVDIVVAGFPCQGHSIAGARGGLEDARSGLFFELIRVVKEMRDYDILHRGRTAQTARPRYLLLENVIYALKCIRHIMNCKHL